jgi:hypothetical protein
MGAEGKLSKEELIAEIQRKVAYLVATDDYTVLPPVNIRI